MANNTSPHILNTSANLLGFCLSLLSIPVIILLITLNIAYMQASFSNKTSR